MSPATRKVGADLKSYEDMIKLGTFRIQTTQYNGTYTKDFYGRSRAQEKYDYETLLKDPTARLVTR